MSRPTLKLHRADESHEGSRGAVVTEAPVAAAPAPTAAEIHAHNLFATGQITVAERDRRITLARTL